MNADKSDLDLDAATATAFEMSVAAGFEKIIVSSWSNWDRVDDFIVQFYDAKVQPVFGLDQDALYTVCIDLEEMTVTIYDNDDAIVKTANIGMSLDNFS
jgi:hypothetical protein